MAVQRVAILGLALRAPGGLDDPESLWAALVEGSVMIGELPEDRRGPFGHEWDEVITRAGYLGHVFDFDRRFFGISPRECRVVDPQHRLLLEVTWEAFEDAGIVPASVQAGTGVVAGITGQDYRHWFRDEPNAWVTTGNGHSFAAGRVAYTLGLRGPTMAVDTACSSSLVAVDAACRLLATGACDLAVAGGVNLILSPRTTREVAQTGALSPDGCSRPFDAAANGFVRGEGCGIVILKRLEDAERDGDRVRAVVDATGTNQDGGTDTFTAPNRQAQADLITAVLASAGIDPREIGYHEAHGTGTPLGDPVEMDSIIQALAPAGGKDREGLYVGSVKGNIGHSESAAGIIGVIKAVLCLERGQVPPQPTFESLNPRIDLLGAPITIPTQLTDWGAGVARRASVNSYGMSGTNAFAVLSPAPLLSDDGGLDGPRPSGFVISAQTEGALRALAARYRDYLSTAPEDDYSAFTHSVNHGRTVLKHAMWVEAQDALTAIAVLKALEHAEPHSHAVTMTEARETDVVGSTGRVPRPTRPVPTYPWQRETYVVSSPADAS